MHSLILLCSQVKRDVGPNTVKGLVLLVKKSHQLSDCHPLSHTVNNYSSACSFKPKLMFLEAPWEQVETEGVSKERLRPLSAFWRIDVPPGLGFNLEELSHQPENSCFRKFTRASHFSLGAISSSYPFCFLCRTSIRIEGPVCLSGRKGMQKGRWREVMQSSKIAYEYWTTFRIFPLSSASTYLIFSKKRILPYIKWPSLYAGI